VTKITFFNTAKMSRHPQRGDALIEAMIGGLLLVILFVGTMLAVSKIMTSQRTMNAQNIVILQMHEALQTNGIEAICGGASAGSDAIAGRTVTFSSTCSNASVTLTMNSLSVAVIGVQGTTFTLSTTSDSNSIDLFGGNTGIINTGY